MKLENELGLRNGIRVKAHEALLNIYYTGDILKKRAREFFSEYGITDVQFNLMELLSYQSDKEAGLTQAELSRMLLVNRSNITSLIDRMEKAQLVVRGGVPGDRRYNAVRLTTKGKETLDKVEDRYMKVITEIMTVLEESELKQLMASLEKIRTVLRK